MDELESIKQKRSKYHHYGDIKKACVRVNVSPAVFQSAMKKTHWADLTDKEIAVLNALLVIQRERFTEMEALKKLMQGNLCYSTTE
jgi:hypothetical protein